MEENGSADRVSDDNYTIIHYASEKPSCSVRGSSHWVQWGIIALCPHMQRVRGSRIHRSLAWLRIKLVCGVVCSISISVHMTMLTSPLIVTISCVLVTRVAASPIETQDEAMEHRAGEALDSLVSEFRDSSVYPLILNPLAVSLRLLPIIQSSDKLSMRFVYRSTSSTAALSSPSTTTPPAPTPPWPWTCASPPSSWPRSIPEPDNCCLIFLFYILYYILLDLSVSWKIY